MMQIAIKKGYLINRTMNFCFVTSNLSFKQIIIYHFTNVNLQFFNHDPEFLFKLRSRRTRIFKLPEKRIY
jgi:hypothetical protein